MSYYSFLAAIILIVLAGESFASNVARKPAAKKEKAARVNFSNVSAVSETQHTICSIKTEDVVARAQSTASRILTGVCTTEEMTKAFENIEKKLSKQLEEFQRDLTTLIQSKFQSGAQKKNYRSSKLSAIKAVDYILDENVFKNYT